MERDLNNDEFELFLKQNADQCKLYPSEKAWKGIYSALHPGMKWFKIGGSVLVLSTLFIIYQETSFFNSYTSPLNKTVSNGSTLKRNYIDWQVPSLFSASSETKSFSKRSVSAGQLAVGSDYKSVVSAGVVKQFDVPASSTLINNASLIKSSIATNYLSGFLLHNNNTLNLRVPVNVTIPSNHVRIVSEQNKQADIITSDDLSKPINATVIGSTLPFAEDVSVKELNWLQEMAAIKLTPQKKSKFNLQFYFSPTVSYRRLADNQNTFHSSILNTPASRDLNINRYVDHNPAIGAELGSNILFALTRNFNLKSGLQLNYSRYNIKAFKSNYEKASIALNTAGHVIDTISSYTSLRNFSGYASEELQNQYLQISVPVGAELKLLGNKRLQFSVAGTIQPTFLLFSDTYLLSTNYLNYTKEPSLVRKWNVHSSFEAFLSYKTGGLRWQLGPQFRYQLMSSFNDRYPIKEYLFEYGVKIGVSKTLR